jgi:glycerol-3-phosphate acyltransferase PlsX
MGSSRAKIAIDAMGGDYAPSEIVAGAIKAQAELGVDILLVGDPEQIKASVPEHQYDSLPEIVPSEGTIEMHEEPLSGIKRKPLASINVAMNLVKQKQADAVISAGHSGAAMAAALLRLGRLPGIDRPAIGAMFPTLAPSKRVLILDVGANVDCRPKYLEQFAVMGSIYSQDVLGIVEPKVGLLNIGEEPTKGNDLALKTYELLVNHPQVSFVGNAEGRDVLSGEFDVIVCDGFAGNVLLKFAEAMGDVLLQVLKEELSVSLEDEALASVLQPSLKRFRERMDHVEHGGALLLGVDGICVIGHGSAKAPSISNAVRLALEAVDREVMDRLHVQFPKND